MRYEGWIRGTTTGKTYKYAGCLIQWDGGNWVAFHPDGTNHVVAVERGIKPMRNTLHAMKMAKEGPWAS
jgi:hypothetical protein